MQIKKSLYLNLWAHDTKHLMNQEANMWKLHCVFPTTAKGFQFQLVAQIIVEINVIHFSNLSWLH
jgi:hypothetical protein